jgi:hypothetical protein
MTKKFGFPCAIKKVRLTERIKEKNKRRPFIIAVYFNGIYFLNVVFTR